MPRQSKEKMAGGRKSSSRRTGVYTKAGRPVYNPKAYAKKAPVYTKSGKAISNATKYSKAVRTSAMVSTAKAVRKQNPSAKAFTYTATLPGGRRYVGMTQNPQQRLSAHLKGHGAKVTRDLKPMHVKITPHASVSRAKKAET